MKKKIVLVSLLILPLFAYIYFSLVKHNSLFLPVVSRNVSDIPSNVTTLNGKPVTLQGKISIVGFTGNDIVKKKETIFNINEKINVKYKGFTDFQIVMLVPEGKEAEVEKVASEIRIMADISNWKFVFASPDEIKKFHQSLGTKDELDADTGTFSLFIVDKDRNLRGRNGNNPKTGKHEFRDTYNSLIVSELHNEMTDDIKILLREYRLALKKNNTAKGVKREI